MTGSRVMANYELASNAIADGMKTVTGKWYGADES